MELMKLPEQGVTCIPAKIDFPAYEEYWAAASGIANYINGIELTQDNVKEVKKVLADARKVTDGLTKRRIEIKKMIMSDYTVFEDRVKELVRIIDEADSALRSRIRELEELEREAKKAQIIELWNKRVGSYRVNDYVTNGWEHWIQPQHLNKTTSWKSIEDDMVDWLEAREMDFETLDSMDPEYKIEYVGCWDLGEAIRKVTDRNKRKEMVEQFEGENPELVTAKWFVVYGDKDIALAEMLLKQHNINFEIC